MYSPNLNFKGKIKKQRKEIKGMDNKHFDENSRRRLVDTMRKEVTSTMEKTLDFAQVACPRDNYQQLRSKILGLHNDCMRNLEKEFNRYLVRYTNVSEEIIEFRNKG